MIRNNLNALRAEYRTAEAELKDAQQEAGYYRRVFQRQKNSSNEALHHALNMMLLNASLHRRSSQPALLVRKSSRSELSLAAN